MHLSESQAKRFYRLFYEFVDYANRKLGIVKGKFEPWSTDEDMGKLVEVVDQVWANPRFIEAFSESNPLRMSLRDCYQVGQWRYGISDRFVAVCSDDVYTYLYSDGYVFGVTGLTREVGDMVGEMPVYVDTTLLPFEGQIVYSINITAFSIALGPGIRKMVEEEYDEALAKGNVVRTADDLTRIAPSYIENAARAAIEHEIDQNELKAAANEEVPGTHRGVLAGLGREERERLVMEHMHGFSGLDPVSVLREGFDERVIPGEPFGSLEDGLMLKTKDTLKALAKDFGMRRYSTLRKSELAHEVSLALASDASGLEALLTFIPQRNCQAIRGVYEEGGSISMSVARLDEGGSEALASLDVLPPFGYVFLHDGTYTAVIMPEMMGALRGVEWDFVDRDRRLERQARDLVEAYLDHCGILPLNDLIGRVMGHCPDQYDPYDLGMMIYDEAADGEGMCRLWLHDDELYATNWQLEPLSMTPEEELRLKRHAQALVAADADLESALTQGEADAVECLYLVSEQAGKPEFWIPEDDEDLLDGETRFGLLDRVFRATTTQGLLTYLDNHVPDDMDDYCFADKVVEGLALDLVRGADTLECMRELVDEYGIASGTGSLNALIEAFFTFYNGLPLWSNAGWSPLELAAEQGITLPGQVPARAKTADGKKIGRNDPCPCGSGKKYKKCCGR